VIAWKAYSTVKYNVRRQGRLASGKNGCRGFGPGGKGKQRGSELYVRYDRQVVEQSRGEFSKRKARTNVENVESGA